VENKRAHRRSLLYFSLVSLLTAALLYHFARINYLLFHIIAEIFSIVIACAVFMISWNARKQIENTFLVYLGIAYLFIGIIDLFHTLSYVGMNILAISEFPKRLTTKRFSRSGT